MSAWNGWRDGPFAGFDTETDSPDPLDARIITAHVGYAEHPTRRETGTPAWQGQDWVLKPERPIPAEATAIHGYDNRKATHMGMERREAVQQIIAALDAAWLAGAPVCAHNASFDLTVLACEAARLGLTFRVGGMVIDTLTLDKQADRFRRGSRKLTDVAAHYGITLTEDEAHTAAADAITATRIAWKLAPNLPVRPGDRQASTDMGMTEQADAYREQRLSLARYFRDKKGDPETAADIETKTDWPIQHAPEPIQEAIV